MSNYLSHITRYCSFGALIVTMWTGISCNYLRNDKNEKPLARVKDKYLYVSDIANLTGTKMNPEDSQVVITSYIHSWINEMLLLDKAEINLKEEQKNFQKRLENYRNSLLIYEYEKKIIQQRLDTNVTLSEIEDYYFTNQQNFTLKEDLVKVNYARISKDAPNIGKIRSIYKSSEDGDKSEFVDYCHQFAITYYDEEEWMLIDDLVKNIPLDLSNNKSYLRHNRFVELQDSTTYYFIQVKDYKIKDSTSPLSFERERIKSIIINQRKLNLIKQMKEDLYNKALAKKDFEIYE